MPDAVILPKEDIANEERENCMENYIRRYENLGYGMFVHFGLYSILGKGEWYLALNKKADKEKYDALTSKFTVSSHWAKDLVRTAKKSGCRYIAMTARHHDGFSLYDTKGLSDFDVMHSACGRDLVKEFVDECNEQGILPVFYHTILDWHCGDYAENFPKYIDYLAESLKLLCTNYGKIGGFWFDGMWDKPDVDWQEDRLYGMIKSLQPEAMIINNCGLSAQGKLGHPLIDGVTFERGKPRVCSCETKHIVGEMCQVLNDHWGYAKDDCNYKSVKSLIEDLVDCRKYDCNFLLNTGLTAHGAINPMDRCIFQEIGKWIKTNRNFIYLSKACGIVADNADVLFDGTYYYAVIKNVGMAADPNVGLKNEAKIVTIHTDKKVRNVKWLDNGEAVKVKNNAFSVVPFSYGTSYSVRVARFLLKDPKEGKL